MPRLNKHIMEKNPGSRCIAGSQLSVPWLIIGGFFLTSFSCAFSGLGTYLNLLFPAMSFGVGLYLYKQHKFLYIEFTWWLWLITPLIRRIADYHSQFTEPSPILLAPFAVTFITFIGLFVNLDKEKIPFTLSLSGIFYGFLVGLIFRPPVKLVISFLEWITPISFAVFIYSNWREYIPMRNLFQRIFVWGILVVGIYGVIQFLFLPEWDKFWMINADFSSAGRPEPLSVNVWSTMSSNQPLGTFFSAGLLYFFISDKKGIFFLGANVSGYLTFLLARKRTAWASFLLGLIFLIGTLNLKKQTQTLLTAAIIIMCVLPLATLDPFSEFIGGRLSTLSTLDEDRSATARQATYAVLMAQAVRSFFGRGLGGEAYDSGIISSLLSLGWFGCVFYFGGLAMLLSKVLMSTSSKKDSFASASRAIILSTLSQFPLTQPHVEIQGMVLWSSIALFLASLKYHEKNGYDYQAS